ncbi:MAG: TnsA endonuclease N-terminal domain-containing protein [Promethearchaeota archaeon]
MNSELKAKVEKLVKKTIRAGGKQLAYYRPDQARNIPLKATSNRGFTPSLKSHLKGLVLEYESQLERDFLFLLDHDINCVDLQTQPVKILYKTKRGKNANIYPDCWAIFLDEKQFLFEIKSERQLQKLIKDENWELRLKAIQKFCKERNWKYQIMTEKKIRCTRLNNIKDLLTSAKHYSPVNINKNIGQFDTNLKKFLKESPKKFEYLVKLMQPFVPLTLKEIISLIKYKIYFQQIHIDWDIPLDDSIISLNGEAPCPVYELKKNYSTIIEKIVSKESIEEKKTTIISEKDKIIYEDRLELITPLINRFGKEGKRGKIEDFCREQNLPFGRIYRWYLKWRKEGDEGLLPKRSKKHNKSHLDSQVEMLLQESIYEYMHGEWQQIKSAYNEFFIKCHKLELTPASYETFRKRIRLIPIAEQIGKFKPKTQEFIKRGLISSYREGRYPGAIIQMDHTILDIWIIDSFIKQPLGRPWLTIGIDVFSRAIWGYFLSLNAPSQETVTNSILNGLSSKKQLIDWKIFQAYQAKEGNNPEEFSYDCGGFPAIIQVDNGMDFRASSVKEFCLNQNITLEFRPVKTPEFGGFIESVWDTINDGIRGAKLPGRVFSRPKSRESVKRPKFKIPPDYNPKDDAALTLDEFREWLFMFFVVKYSSSTKSRQMHSPNEVWLDGLTGENHQPIGGGLKILSKEQYDILDFQTKITVSSKLSQKGLRYRNILYSSKWLVEARKKRILNDGENHEFKISNWDIRYSYIINPKTHEIEKLEAYKYDGDDRITRFILRGLGKELGYKEFTISMKMIQDIKKILRKTNVLKEKSMVIIEQATNKARKIAEENIQDRKMIDNLLKTKTGKKKISAANIIARMDEKPISPHKNVEETIETFVEENEDEIEPYPTTWEEAKKGLLLSDINKIKMRGSKE